MLSLFRLTYKSLLNRKGTVALTVVSIGLSVALLFGVERIRNEARTSFTNTVSGTDLIVGARTSPISLLLASVFHIGDATSNMSWSGVKLLADHPAVAWTIPLSLGDSHRGYRVLGTTPDYFEHYQYGRQQSLRLRDGVWFVSDSDAVLGAEVAEALGYELGTAIVVAHGAGDVSFIEHDEHPFTVVGILARTGTPVDRTIHVSLDGIDAMHVGLSGGQCDHDHGHDPLALCEHDHAAPERSISALLVGLKSRSAVLGVQRMVNEYAEEALTAAVPGLALQELWEVVGLVEKALLAVSGFVVLVGLAGMLAALMTNLNERRREMAILRSVGARPSQVFGLIVGESALITAMGLVLGMVLLQVGLTLLEPICVARFGLHLPMGWLSAYELLGCCVILIAGSVAGAIPAWRGYRYSLADGLTVRI